MGESFFWLQFCFLLLFIFGGSAWATVWRAIPWGKRLLLRNVIYTLFLGMALMTTMMMITSDHNWKYREKEAWKMPKILKMTTMKKKGLFWIWCSITGNHDYELWHWSASSRPRLGPGKEFPHDAGGDLASVSGNCLIVIDAPGPPGYHTVWSEQLGNI